MQGRIVLQEYLFEHAADHKISLQRAKGRTAVRLSCQPAQLCIYTGLSGMDTLQKGKVHRLYATFSRKSSPDWQPISSALSSTFPLQQFFCGQLQTFHDP